ncbi:WD40/YVTN/BNR-like repeat-containing protein, partial [Acidobacteriota bacterium]
GLHEGVIGGEVYRSYDGGESWKKVSPDGLDLSGKAAYSFNEIYADPKDPEKVFLIGVSMMYSLDGGKTWPQRRGKERFLSNFGDVRTFWIDPADPEHMMLGSDGGIYATWDGGRNMFHYYQIPLGEIYHVEVDNAHPYNVYAGLQDHEAWKGPSNGWSGSVGLEDWVITGMWDGMYTKVNPENNRWLYFTTQFGKHHREDQLKGERVEITPIAAEGKPPYRYTWTTPLELSPHNPDIVYTGGQMLLRSLDRGNTWEELSPDLTTNDAVKIAGQGHIMFCTITTISESPVKAGVIWVGTDDGRIWLTKDHGAHWIEFTQKITALGGPKDTWVSRIEASSHSEGAAYMTKSGYREDVFEPYIYRTENFGETWEDISGNLPDAPISVIYEDWINPDLLFVGNDIGVYFSLSGGDAWIPLKNNMPPVPIRDLLVHPREQDLVVGSYGRGVWVTNVSPLQELTQEVQNSDFHLFRILDKPVSNRSQRARWGNYQMTGDAHYRTRNEPSGLQVYYYLKENRDEALELIVEDLDGKVFGKFKSETTAGIHRFVWPRREGEPGTYRIILTDGTKRVALKGNLLPALTWPVGNPDNFR